MVMYMAHYLRNTEKNGIEIYFDGKPSDDVLNRLKDNRWRWFRAKSCWYNRYSAENEAFAKELCEGKSRIQTEKTSTSKSYATLLASQERSMTSVWRESGTGV